RQRAARRLRVEAQLQTAFAARAVAIAHAIGPDFARRAILRDLLEEVAVRVEEEAEPRRELVDIEAALQRPVHGLVAAGQRERQLLHGRWPGFADMIAADRYGVELQRMTSAVFDRVRDQPHRGLRREDVLLLRDVLLQDVVLQRAA